MFRFYVGRNHYAVLADPQTIQSVLRNPNCYDKDATYNFFNIPNILFTANGEPWATERKVVSPAYSPRIISAIDPTYSHRIRGLVDALRKRAATGEVFNLIEHVLPMAIDTICDTFMGISIDMQARDNAKYVKALLRIPDLFIERVVIPVYQPDIIYSLTGKKKEYQSYANVLFALVREVLEKKMEHRAELRQTSGASHEAGTKLFLDILLDKFEASEKKDMDLLTYETGELFVAGTVTISTMVSWVCLLSGVFPEVGDKLRAEIDSCVEDAPNATIEDCAKLEYLDLVVKEALRHFTVPFIARKAKKDIQVPDVGTVPENTRFLVSLLSLHHDARYWEKPYEFYPEHFLPENVEKRPKFAYIPFSTGMRDCPGAKYAIQSMKVEVVRILSQFKIASARMKPWKNPFTELSLGFGFTFVPTRGWLVTAELRNQSSD
ncbi:cytochrome P450 4C1 [Bemisia tabaci]|uniref:cytochrome P450 4C1 n=1 Tax=Bemisia tabaci TaxID=7038 RepID=UPI003B27F722